MEHVRHILATPFKCSHTVADIRYNVCYGYGTLGIGHVLGHVQNWSAYASV